MATFSKLSSIELGDVKITYLPDGGGIAGSVASYPASSAEHWKKYPDLLNEDGISTI